MPAIKPVMLKNYCNHKHCYTSQMQPTETPPPCVFFSPFLSHLHVPSQLHQQKSANQQIPGSARAYPGKLCVCSTSP